MKQLIPTLSLIFLLAYTATAQVVDRAEQRTRQKANQRIDRKIDSGIDSGLDAIEGLFSKKNKNQRESGADTEETEATDEQSMRMAMRLMGAGGTADVPEHYAFDMSVEIRMTFYDRRGKKGDENDMEVLISNESAYTGIHTTIEGHTSTVIFDLERNQMVTFVNAEGQKMGMVMSFDAGLFDDGSEEDEAASLGKFKATGEQKKIAGYTCKAYEYIDEGNKAEQLVIWTTTETDVDWMRAFSGMAQNNPQLGAPGNMPDTWPEGAVMQMVSTAKNGERSEMTVLKVNEKKAERISTAGYTMMNMGGKRR